MNQDLNKDKIIIVDFGSQFTKLIARRIREYSVFSEILTIKDLKKNIIFQNVKGIILSGGPATVTKNLFPKIPNKIFNLNIPILGICYGLQLIVKQFRGKVKSNLKKREFGRAILSKKKNSLLTKNFFKKNKSSVWMSHQDSASKLPLGFSKIASTNQSELTIIENKKKKIYGIQFHPEVTHTENGGIILKDSCSFKGNNGASYYYKNPKLDSLKNIQKDSIPFNVYDAVYYFNEGKFFKIEKP